MRQVRVPTALGSVLLALALVAAPAGAAIVEFDATIDGAQETPPNASAAMGMGTFVMDTEANTLSFSIFLTVLPPSGETAAHIHGFAPPGTPAGILFPLPAGNPKNGVWNYDEAQEADIIAGLTYVNIHSVDFPGGEIRGQIEADTINTGVQAKKLIMLDKLAASGKAKVAFVVKDAGVTKGPGTDVEDISARLLIEYIPGSVGGAFNISAGDESWLLNSPTVAKFVNQDPLGFSTYIKILTIKPGKSIKVVAKDALGDGTPLDIVALGPPSGSVFTTFRVENGDILARHCSEFTACTWKSLADGTGAKVVCKNGVPEPTCAYSP